MKPSKAISTSLILAAGTQLSGVLAAPAPLRQEVGSHQSNGGALDSAPRHFPAQEPIIQQASGVSTDAKAQDALFTEVESVESTPAPWDDFVETILDEEEVNRHEREVLTLSVKCNELVFI